MARADLGQETPDESPDFPDWLPDGPKAYVLPRFRVWLKSGLTVYPNGKAYDDQPMWLLEAFNTLLWRYNYWVNEFKPRR